MVRRRARCPPRSDQRQPVWRRHRARSRHLTRWWSEGIGRLGAAMLVALVVAMPIGIGEVIAVLGAPTLFLAGVGVGVSSSVIQYLCDQLGMARLLRATSQRCSRCCQRPQRLSGGRSSLNTPRGSKSSGSFSCDRSWRPHDIRGWRSALTSRFCGSGRHAEDETPIPSPTIVPRSRWRRARTELPSRWGRPQPRRSPWR